MLFSLLVYPPQTLTLGLVLLSLVDIAVLPESSTRAQHRLSISEGYTRLVRSVRIPCQNCHPKLNHRLVLAQILVAL